MNRASWAIAAGLLAIGAIAQAQTLPKDISGRWSWAARGVSQTFSLDDIQRKDDASFTANATWWTMDSKCAVRSMPITGRITSAGLAFDLTTKCDVSFTAELHRADKGWEGTATTKGAGQQVTVDIKAN